MHHVAIDLVSNFASKMSGSVRHSLTRNCGRFGQDEKLSRHRAKHYENEFFHVLPFYLVRHRERRDYSDILAS
jgi:hypothetical protein